MAREPEKAAIRLVSPIIEVAAETVAAFFITAGKVNLSTIENIIRTGFPSGNGCADTFRNPEEKSYVF